MPTTNRPLTILGLVLGMFMAALEATVVSTAMPTVVGDLGGIHRYSWVFTAYMVASTVTVPIFGKLADMFGRKPVLLGGSVLFLIGSAASGAAGSMTQLIAFRTLQGLGAGAMQPITLTIVGDLYGLAERARVQAFFGSVWAVAGLVGPLAGGLIVDVLSWRWVFYVNLPFGVASLALVGLFFRESVERKVGRIDWLGAAVLTALVLALLAAAHGRGVGTAALVASVPLALLLVLVELRAPDPVLPVPLFRRRVMWVTAVASAASGGAMFCTVTYVPLLVQAVMRGSPTEAGGAIAPMLVAWPLASFLAGRYLPRIGFRPLIRLGLVVSCVALFALAWFVDHDPSLWPLRLSSAVFGFGMGLSTTSLVIAVQTSVDWQERGVATAGALFSRIMGGTLAVGALGGLLTRALLADRSIPEHAADELLGPHRGAGLDPEMLDRIAEALTGGLVTIFWVTAALGALALAVGVFFPRVSTKSTAPGPR